MEKSNNLELIRSQLGLSNRDFAARLGIHETMYTKIKSGNYPIGDKTVNKIKKAFPEYSVDWLLFNKGEQFEKEGLKEEFNQNLNMKDQKQLFIDLLTEKLEAVQKENISLREELELYKVRKKA